MSARELQHVAVRMLHDPAFRERVWAEPDRALAGLALTDAERGFLARTDRRAWQVDPHRPWRVLTALIAELPVTVALLGRPQRLEAFFASDGFHAAIRQRMSLFEAFPRWLGDTVAKAPAERAMLTLESAFIAVRRAPPRSVASGPRVHLVTPPSVRAVVVPAGTLAAWELARAQLGPAPLDKIVNGMRLAVGRLGPGDEHVIVERPSSPDEVSAEPVAGYAPAELHALIAASQAGPRPIGRFVADIVGSGATNDEAHEILDDLVRDGLLVPC